MAPVMMGTTVILANVYPASMALSAKLTFQSATRHLMITSIATSTGHPRVVKMGADASMAKAWITSANVYQVHGHCSSRL